MKSSLLTATACLAVVMLAATTASAQMYQSGHWDSYRGNGPDWSSYRSTSPQPYSHGATHGNAYSQPHGFSYNTPDAGSHNTGQNGSYGDVYGTRDQPGYGQSYGNQYQTQLRWLGLQIQGFLAANPWFLAAAVFLRWDL